MSDPLNKLDLQKSDDEIHQALQSFQVKWQRKASRAISDDRISRF